MQPLSAAVGMPLYWVQPEAFGRAFDLRSGDTLFGRLRFRSAFGTLATAELADGSWTLKRVGFLNPRVTVRQAGADADLAVFQPAFWGGGQLALALGARYEWKSIGFWRQEWGFVDSQGEWLVTLRHGSEKGGLANLFKTQAVVEVHPFGPLLTELPMLVALAWYLMILQDDDAAAASSAAV